MAEAMVDKEDRTRLERLVAIDERINSNRYPTMRVLCQSFNVKPRTIYADIRLLRERFGLDIRFDRFRNGYYNANPGKRIPIGDLVEDDYILLIAGCLALKSFFGTQVESVLSKVVSTMSKRLTFDLTDEQEHLERIFIRSSKALSEIDPAILAHLSKALLQNRIVELESEGNVGSFVPCSFVENNDHWLLLAYNLATSAIERHDLGKIVRCEVKEEQPSVNRNELLARFLGA
jgi:predicted DNA-binding transcriptional regulator YafY